MQCSRTPPHHQTLAAPRVAAALASAAATGVAPPAAAAALHPLAVQAASSYASLPPPARADLLAALERVLSLARAAAADAQAAAVAAAADASASTYSPIVYDLETTGRSVRAARIVEVGAVALETGAWFSTLVNCAPIPVDPAAAAATGITTDMAHDPGLPTWAEVGPAFVQFVESQAAAGGGDAAPTPRTPLLIAHNGARFDNALLANECARHGVSLPSHWATLDTLTLARAVLPHHSTHALQPLASALGVPPPAAAHRAADDATLLAAVLEELLVAGGLPSVGHAAAAAVPGVGVLPPPDPLAAASVEAVGVASSMVEPVSGEDGGGTARSLSSLSPPPSASSSSLDWWAAVATTLPPLPDGVPPFAMPADAGAVAAAGDAAHGFIGPEPEEGGLASALATALTTPSTIDAAALPLDAISSLKPKQRRDLAAAGFSAAADVAATPPRAYTSAEPVLSPGVRVRVSGSIASVRPPSRASRASVMPVRIEVDVDADAVPAGASPRVAAVKFFAGRAARFAADKTVATLPPGTRVVLLATLKDGPPPPAGGAAAWETDGAVDVLPASDPKASRVLAPLYAARTPLKPDRVDDAVGTVLAALPGGTGGALPDGVARAAALDAWRAACATLHEPPSLAAAAAARRRLALEELIVMEVALARARQARAASASRGESTSGAAWSACRASAAAAAAALPFDLTPGQTAALEDVLADCTEGAPPASRLLQGDVGSGKTAVALCALVAAAGAGVQAALMAPTEVLAVQLHANLVKLVDALPGDAPLERPRVTLLTGSTPRADRTSALSGLADGSIHLAVGTHALASDAVTFSRLGLAVVDEQHRFGVAQRAALTSKATPPPHVLSMSATPIPRTLALVASGEAACSVVEGKPPGRGRVATRVVLDGDEGRAAVTAALRGALAAGGRAFVVCPRVEGAAGEGAGVDGPRAAEDEAARLAGAGGGLGESVRVGILHGRLPPAEKAAALDAFRSGKVNLLIATSVVEVGVDVPEATVMVVEGADRFGLAALHQLRGRVGRGGADGACLLVAHDPVAAARLAPLAASDDGFVIAEADLAERGPGEFLGTRQSGRAALGGLRAARLPDDLDLLPRARRVGGALVEVLPADVGEWPAGLAAAVGGFAVDDAVAASADVKGGK